MSRSKITIGIPPSVVWLVSLIWITCAFGCSDDEAQTDAVDAGGDAAADQSDLPEDLVPEAVPVQLSSLAITQNPSNMLSYFVEWRSEPVAATHLEVDCGDAFRHTYHSDAHQTDHSVFVAGLLFDLQCDLEVSVPNNEETDPLIAELEIDGIPFFLDPMTVSTADEARMEPGWTIWSLSSAAEDGPAPIQIVDPLGRHRWYWRPTYDIDKGAGNEIQVVPGGLLVGSGGPDMILGWEGDVAVDFTFDGHHDIRPSPFNDNHILFFGYTDEGCDHVEHSLVEWDLENDTRVWSWRICEHYTPRINYVGWTHLNTIEPFPNERALLISSRNQDVIVKVNRDSGAIEWVLGADGDFEMDLEDTFLRQHSPEILANGNILLFDNGLDDGEASHYGEDPALPREFSRAIELSLSFDGDGQPQRAEVVWDYTDPALFAFARSEADRLANGNTLITYSQLRPDRRSMLLEVTHDREVVWQLETPPDRSTYRSERIEPFYGYVR